MTTKPWIGIPTRSYEKTNSVGQNRQYIEAVLWAGGLPLFIPSVEPPVVQAYLDRVGDPAARHIVRLTEGSLVARLAGSREVEVNSFHHQAIERPGRNLRVVATASDGVIEGVEDTTGRFIVGVQWHPERDWSADA